ncbi:hypothetical protein HDR59_04930 [bacterium]|nr:hypothetical protein [bacterium]
MFRKKLKSDINPEAIFVRKSGLYMSFVRMCLFMVAMTVLISFVAPTLRNIFLSNKVLNSFILIVFVFGVFINFRNTIMLIGDVDWINDFFAGRDKGRVPNIITPVAFLLKEHRKARRPYMEAGTMRTLLGIIDSRLSDYKESAGYFSGVLVFLGLLGTFWGLLLTIGSVGDVVRNLDIVGGNVGAMFESLKANISKPLSGMGTAFSTSLFGLGSSLILGFLQLQTNLAQHFFYNELEENMTRYTRIISASALAEGGDGSIITYLQAMLEQTGDNINTLQKTVMKSIDSNAELSHRMTAMAEQTSKLATQMQEKLKVMEKISVAPEKLYPVLNDLVKISKSGFGMDDKTRDHIRNMDLGLSDMTEKLSSDIRLLAKTVAMTNSENKKDKK